jgi:hypothetical protein
MIEGKKNKPDRTAKWAITRVLCLTLLFSVCLFQSVSYASNGVFTATGSMTAAREGLAASRLPSGKVLVTGGTNRTTIFNTAELYDPQTGKFSQTGSMNVARYGHTATVLNNGRVLITGGMTNSNGTATNSAEIYDSSTGTFYAAGNMNNARCAHTATLLFDGKVLIAGGFFASGPSEIDTAELYDPATNSFVMAGKMSQKKGAHTATLLKNGKVLIAGGSSYASGYATAELFDPATLRFTLTGSLSQARYNYSAVLLNNGMVLVFGGITNVATAELYDPLSGTFNLTANMNTGGSDRKGALLPDGNVLVSGGSYLTSVWETLPSAEIYNTVTKTFTAIRNMVSPRATHATVALNDGSVLLVGGYSGSNGANTSSSAELYVPTSTSTSLLDISNWDITNGIAGMSNGQLTVGANRTSYGDVIRSKQTYSQPMAFTWKGYYPLSSLSAHHTGIGQTPFNSGGSPSILFSWLTAWNYPNNFYIIFPGGPQTPPAVPGISINNSYIYGEFKITWNNNTVTWYFNGNQVGQQPFVSSSPVYLYFLAYDRQFQIDSISVTTDIASSPTNATCGSANTTTVSTGPTTNLCTTGTASTITGTGPWSWTCSGSNGGTNASCSANIQTFNLTTTKAGNGVGIVTSVPAAISCGATCTASYTIGTSVTLTATPTTGSSLISWNGCDSTSTNTCTVTMSAAKSVTAIFNDTAAPTVDTLSPSPIPNSLSTRVTFAASDNINVTGYYLSETNDDPVAGSTGWQTTAPTYFTFSTFGTKTLYAWAKDAAGNVSTLKTASVTLIDLSPTVTSSAPSSGSTSIALNSIITVNFSEAIEATSINPAKLLKLGNTWIPGSGSFDKGNVVYIFTPSTPLSYGTSYTYTIDTVKDLTGNRIVTPYSASFTTIAKPVNVIIPTLTLALSASSTLIDNSGPITVSGSMTAGSLKISDQPITITVTKPDGTSTLIPLVTDAYGAFSTNLRSNLTSGGRYSVQASAGGVSTSSDILITTIAPATSAPSVIRGLDQSGIAIIVTGSIPSGEGKDNHKKTTARVKNALKARGFAETDIITIESIPGSSGKTALASALATVKTAISAKPASLHLILVDHGNKAEFLMDSEKLTPTELNTLLDTFENGLSPQALDQPRYITIGACYSGSFIDTIKKNGRTIITSAKDNEQSFRGPAEPDSIRSGEYFLDEYYGALKKGKSIRDAFNLATANTATHTRRGGIVSSFGDRILQNPLISVNGSTGTNWLPTGYDDNAPDTLYLGTGDDASFVASQIRTEKSAKIEAIFLDDTTISATITTTGTAGQTAWFEYRAPSNKLTATGGSNQLEVKLPKLDMTWNATDTTYQATFNNFIEFGSYEISIYLQDAAGDITRKQINLYRNQKDNRAPLAVTVLTPPDGDTVQSTVVPTWNMTSDPDSDMLSYTLVVSKTADMKTIVHVQEGLTTPYAIINYEDGLLDLSTYYWQVIAIDSYGAQTASAVRHFTTDNRNGIPVAITGKVRDIDGIAVAGAIISIAGTTVTAASNGGYVAMREAGSYSISAIATGYTQSQTSNIIAVTGRTVINDIVLTPIVLQTYSIDVLYQGLGQGNVECTNPAKEGTTITCMIQPAANYKLLKIEGDCSGTQTGNQYSFTAAKNCSLKPTFNAVVLYGDCDSSKDVTISEVQSAINMFLGLKQPLVCVDFDNSGAVSISEVQKAINSFLGL